MRVFISFQCVEMWSSCNFSQPKTSIARVQVRPLCPSMIYIRIWVISPLNVLRKIIKGQFKTIKFLIKYEITENTVVIFKSLLSDNNTEWFPQPLSKSCSACFMCNFYFYSLLHRSMKLVSQKLFPLGVFLAPVTHISVTDSNYELTLFDFLTDLLSLTLFRMT